MDSEIEMRVGGMHESPSEASGARRLVPMRIGNATVYIEQIGEPVLVESDDSIYPVAPSPKGAFETATEALRECVHAIGEQFERLAEKAKPQEVTVEFTLTFDVKGKVSPIPVLVTGEAETQTGLRVTAVWRHDEEAKQQP
jgi:Trypsin-co-occurring domain 1